jgi:hypothetical protein
MLTKEDEIAGQTNAVICHLGARINGRKEGTN